MDGPRIDPQEAERESGPQENGGATRGYVGARVAQPAYLLVESFRCRLVYIVWIITDEIIIRSSV